MITTLKYFHLVWLSVNNNVSLFALILRFDITTVTDTSGTDNYVNSVVKKDAEDYEMQGGAESQDQHFRYSRPRTPSAELEMKNYEPGM